MPVKDFLSGEEIQEIKKRHRQCRWRRYADRWKAMLPGDGYSFAEVSAILILDDDTVRNGYHIFGDEGIAGLERDLYKGGTSRLDGAELDSLAAHMEANLFLTARVVCQWVKSEWGVECSDSGMTDLPDTMGFAYQQPTVTPGRAPAEEEQPAFAAQIVATIGNKGLDGGYYKCKAMREYWENPPGIQFIPLSPRCPNLHWIGRSWKFYPQKVPCQAYSPALQTMWEATLAFFGRLQDDAEELRTLLTLNFQIVIPKVSETRGGGL
jgi:transposase